MSVVQSKSFCLQCRWRNRNLNGIFSNSINMSDKTCTRAELSVHCDKNCLVAAEDRIWYYFLATSAVIFFGGLVSILISRIIRRICDSKRSKLNPTKKDGNKKINGLSRPDVSKRGIYVWLKEQAATLITAQTFKGRCLVSTVMKITHDREEAFSCFVN